MGNAAEDLASVVARIGSIVAGDTVAVEEQLHLVGIVFLRFGDVVGQAGVFSALVIVAASETIIGLTTLSSSAIATNPLVTGGGATT